MKNNSERNGVTAGNQERMEQLASESCSKVGVVAVGLICVDNYQEVQSSLDEEKWPLLIALIDRKLSSFCQSLDGILCKYEKDRYIFIISMDALNAAIERKFEILDQIRGINIGNNLPATLSIGVGVSVGSLAQGMEYAKYALDLALGRGGDQALIKDENGYSFFGGKSASQDRGGSVRSRVKSSALRQLISDAESVYVMGHARPDLDSIGSSIGIYIMARHFGKKCGIVIQELNSSDEKLFKRISEDKEYNDLFITCEKALKSFNRNSLLVIVDAHRPGICECPALIEAAEKIVVIDHHRKSPEFIENCVLIYHEPYASSAAELIAEMLRYFDASLSIKPLEADALLAGITLDTKNFSIKTGTRTFEAAAFLRRHHADTMRVRKLLQNDMESFRVRNEVVKDAQIFKDDIAISVCPHNVRDASLVTAQAADELLNIMGIQASFVLTLTDLYIMISARSLGEINVQRIMEKLGGGGHRTVAGAQLSLESDMDIETAIQMIKDAIVEYLEKES